MTRARLIGIALAIVVAACGREGADESKLAARPSATPRAAKTVSATADPVSGAATTPRPSDAAKAGAAATPASGAASGGRPSAAPTAAKGAATGGRPSAAPTLVRPATGKYGFHEKGTRRAGSTGQDQPYETDGSLTVSASGARTTLRFATAQGSEELTLRYETSKAFLERARIEQTVASFDARFDPPQLVLRAPMNPGDAWTNKWASDGTSGTTKIRIARKEPVSAMGKRWDAVVIVNETTASGDAKGNTTSTSWYVPELGLDVKRVSDFDGTYQGIAYKQHSERTLTSRP